MIGSSCRPIKLIWCFLCEKHLRWWQTNMFLSVSLFSSLSNDWQIKRENFEKKSRDEEDKSADKQFTDRKKVQLQIQSESWSSSSGKALWKVSRWEAKVVGPKRTLSWAKTINSNKSILIKHSARLWLAIFVKQAANVGSAKAGQLETSPRIESIRTAQRCIKQTPFAHHIIYLF